MQRSTSQLRDDALAIWRAGVEAIDPLRLMAQNVRVDGDRLLLGDLGFNLSAIRRIAVVGAGKAGAGMAIGLEQVFGEELLREKQIAGLLSVPADCLAPTKAIKLVAGRPAGINEPRPEGAKAAQDILQIVKSLHPEDLCICLLSGGGSALLPAPIDGITLAQKAAVTRLLSGAGADIQQLNAVRKHLSRIKGGGLARSCQAGNLVTLILSDVLGDPLDVIASGPTVENQQSVDKAVAVFEELAVANHPDAQAPLAALRLLSGAMPQPITAQTHNLVIANNATAVDAAGIEAERRGYSHAMNCAIESEGPAEEVARHLAAMARRMRDEPGPDCLITGGEPTVKLADISIRGRGGRNQQLALAALADLGDCRDVALLSGGTDGEDGPTNAAGAWIDQQVAKQAAELRLDHADYLRRNDAYTFFQLAGGLLTTGPTGANACDVRVVTVNQNS